MPLACVRTYFVVEGPKVESSPQPLETWSEWLTASDDHIKEIQSMTFPTNIWLIKPSFRCTAKCRKLGCRQWRLPLVFSRPRFRLSHPRHILPLHRLLSPHLPCARFPFCNLANCAFDQSCSQTEQIMALVDFIVPPSLLVLIYSTEFLGQSSLFESEVHFEKLLQQNGSLEEILHTISSCTRRSG